MKTRRTAQPKRAAPVGGGAAPTTGSSHDAGKGKSKSSGVGKGKTVSEKKSADDAVPVAAGMTVPASSPNTRTHGRRVAEMTPTSPTTRVRHAAIAAGKALSAERKRERGRSGVTGAASMVLPMSPNTRARRAAEMMMSPMSPNTRSRHADQAASTIDERKRPASDDERKLPASSKKRAKKVLDAVEDDDDDSAYDDDDERKRPAFDDERKRPASDDKRAKKVFNAVEDDDDDSSAYDDDIAHGNQITEFGKTFKVDAVVKEFIFPNVKFAVKDLTLKFSNSEGSVCRQMAEKLKIADDEVEDWWDCQRDRVYNQLKGLRNNTIKGLKKLFKGKRSDMDDEMCCECLLVDHCLTPFLMQKDVFEKVHKIWLVWKTKTTLIS